ncbi:helix-turn-helix domain-containing protein [Paraburkholderia sp. MM5477-R1]|uniref:helix-turn-helix domain-containing protein n=1 Tax=Paraburkholderia sp. MM5477-R1 TaxID=2991062 RepID=UPI003D259C91
MQQCFSQTTHATPYQKHVEQQPAFLTLPNWTVEETATYLRCEPQTIRKAISTKGSYHGLKPRRFGRRWFFRAADVRSMLEAA